MISQPVSSISPVLHCPLGLGEPQTCPFPDVVSYLFLCLPCLLPPVTVPCKMALEYLTFSGLEPSSVTNDGPTLWTQSLDITLPENGNLQKCQNYRTISLISHPSSHAEDHTEQIEATSGEDHR